MRRLAVCLAAAGVLAPIVLAQQPVFRSGVDAVRVDVSVMNGVRPVAGLTAGDLAALIMRDAA